MAMEAGQQVVGAKGEYLLLKELEAGVTHTSRVFKAEVLNVIPTRFVLVKTASPDDRPSRIGLKREYDAYQRPSIGSSPAFRAMEDTIGDPEEIHPDHAADTSLPVPGLVLEWLDQTLADTPLDRGDYVLLDAIVNAGLSGLAVLGQQGLVHTDFKPDNILLSGVGTRSPIVKIGDLGLVRPEGFTEEAQPFAMRAPEVYQGLGCFHRSEVWAFAVTLFCCMKPGPFGISGNIYSSSHNDYWCIAKLMKLFPELTEANPADKEVIQGAFDIARLLTSEPDPDNRAEPCVKVATLAEEMATANFEPEMRNLFESLFVVDSDARPTAAEALASREYLALNAAASSQIRAQ